MAFKDLVDCMLGVIIPACGEKNGVRYQHKTGGAEYGINAVFDESWELVDPETEAIISSNQPKIGIRLRDLHKVPDQDDHVIIGSKRYLVKDSLEDGQGGASLVLHFNYDEKDES